MKNKKWLKGICALMLVAVQSVSVFGAVANVNVDGNHIDFGTDESVIIDGTTYVPIRAVFENFGEGTTVDWDAETKAVSINCGGEELVLYIKTGDVSYKGNDTVLSNVPVIQDGRTLLPLRELCEMLGGSVEWDAETKTVDITSPNATTNEEVQTPTQTEVVIPSGIDAETADEIRAMAGKTLPECIYIAMESENTYGKEEMEAICSVADCRGYYNLEQVTKIAFDYERMLQMDYDTYEKTSNKFAYEYFTALFKLEDKSFIKNSVMKDMFVSEVVCPDSTVSAKDTATLLSSALDLNSEKISVNPNMELLTRAIYAYSKAMESNNYVSDFYETNSLEYIVMYADYMLKENPGWASMMPNLTELFEAQEKVSAEIESYTDMPLPKALYFFLNDKDTMGSLNAEANLKRLLEIADSNGYEKLKTAFEKVASEGLLNNEDDYNPAFKLYFEALDGMSDKSFLEGTTAKIYNTEVIADSSVTVDEMLSSIDKRSQGDTSVKVVAPPDLELLAKILLVTLQEYDNADRDDPTFVYITDYLAGELTNNEKIVGNYNASQYILSIVLYMYYF